MDPIRPYLHARPPKKGLLYATCVLVSGNGRLMPGDTRPGTVTIVTDSKSSPAPEAQKQPEPNDKKESDKKESEKKESDTKQPEKKKGFWGRIFGR